VLELRVNPRERVVVNVEKELYARELTRDVLAVERESFYEFEPCHPA